jgi:TolB protein
MFSVHILAAFFYCQFSNGKNRNILLQCLDSDPRRANPIKTFFSDSFQAAYESAGVYPYRYRGAARLRTGRISLLSVLPGPDLPDDLVYRCPERHQGFLGSTLPEVSKSDVYESIAENSVLREREKVKKIVIFYIFLLLAPSMSFARQGNPYFDAGGIKQPPMAITQPRSLGGEQDSHIAREIEEVLKFDLNLAGTVRFITVSSKENTGGIRPGEFDFAPWKTIGAALLLKTGYFIDGNQVMLEFRLYDVQGEKPVLATVYTGKRKFLREMAHAFADETMGAVTGEKGPFTGKIVFVSARTGNKEVYIMDYDGYNERRITGNGSINLNPTFSPNGREIIYTSYKKGNPDLYRKEIFTGAETRISSRAGLNVTGAWCPHGGKIALAMSKDGNSQIYLIDRNGKELARLTKDDSINISPSWSPNGSQIAFVSDRDGTPQIFIMNADGSNVHRLTTSGTYNVDPSWSPRGDCILYCRMQSNGFQIHSVNPDGTGDIQLTTVGRNEYPHWSSDGRFVTFTSNRDGKESIYIMRADGKSQIKVSRNTDSDSQPVWSPRP